MSCNDNTSTSGIDIKSASAVIYHEKQSRELCALHALNNLFQDQQAFTKKHLDDICSRLSPSSYINPHRSMFGLGNYDVNVIISALQTKNYETVWFDKRKSLDLLIPEQVFGFILNIAVSEWRLVGLRLPLPHHFRHWVALRRCSDGVYYSLDSKRPGPDPIGTSAKDLCQHLRTQLDAAPDRQLLVVMNVQVARDKTWLRTEPISDDSSSKEQTNDELSSPKQLGDEILSTK